MTRTLLSFDTYCVQQADRIRQQLGLQRERFVSWCGTKTAVDDADNLEVLSQYQRREDVGHFYGF